MRPFTSKFKNIIPIILVSIFCCLIFLSCPVHAQMRKENPRPDWNRKERINLNGNWRFDFDADEIGIDQKWYDPNHQFSQTIRVPFCWESSLSKINKPSYLGQAWYQRTFSVPKKWRNKKIFISFGAVDWKCKLWVNGQYVGEHTGGYNPFEFDISKYASLSKRNTITLWVEDKASANNQNYPALIGKQGYDAPCGYTHTSGIWQTVTLEARNATYITDANFQSNIDKKELLPTLHITASHPQKLKIEYRFNSKCYNIEKQKNINTHSQIVGHQFISLKKGNNAITLKTKKIDDLKLWSYNQPNLYYGSLTLSNSKGKTIDCVHTYFGVKSVATHYYKNQKDVKYVYINKSPVYLSGVLDQGFWEKGIYTAPSQLAYKKDVLFIKNSGFNYMRKHIKLEDPLEYYWCDKLGLMVMQDVPWGTGFVPESEGGAAPGRQYYEDCLNYTLQLSERHPSIFSVALFNETWGLKDAYQKNRQNIKASDGMDTIQWISYLYKKAKKFNSNLLIEDMSACNNDHIQPTDLNSSHTYPKTYEAAKKYFTSRSQNAYSGSSDNFAFGNKQDGDPILNTEYGGVAAHDGDFDISYCFKYLTDLQRQTSKQGGLLYTEPYDVEYERNGLLTYDRKPKVMGYRQSAYGNDMTIKDLVGDTYIGTQCAPVTTVAPKTKMNTKCVMISWKKSTPKQVKLKWHFDATDDCGKAMNLKISGEKNIHLKPYEKATTTIHYQVPSESCVGTLTVWLEDNKGKKITKNFTNVIVQDDQQLNASIEQKKPNLYLLRAKTRNANCDVIEQNGFLSYEYALPQGLNLNHLKEVSIIAEISSNKKGNHKNVNTSSYHSAYSQTEKNEKYPSNITVSVNGQNIKTVTVSNNPRDIRGTLSLRQPYNNGSSAGDFGYLVKIDLNHKQLHKLKESLKSNNKLTVIYSVNGKKQHGMKIYSHQYGRYLVDPEILIDDQLFWTLS